MNKIQNSVEFRYDRDEPQEITLNKGFYLVEAWGASGGGEYGGKGAYVRATLSLHKILTLFAYVGGKGKSPPKPGVALTPGGYNGGGAGGQACSNSYYSGSSGGGATDLRLNHSLDSRLLVAAGGGGSAYSTYSQRFFKGGYGGDDTGGLGEILPACNYTVEPATQTSGNPEGKGQDGRNSSQYYDSGAEGNGGGGGGYFGGLSIQFEGKNTISGGGGGSSFINQTLFTRRQMFAGYKYIFLPNGTQSIGNPDDGYLRITMLSIISCKHLYFNIQSLFFVAFFSS